MRISSQSSMVALTLGIVLASVGAASGQVADVTFKKDIKQYLVQGDDRDDISASVRLTAKTLEVVRKGNDVTSVPYSSITSITYDRRSRMRKMAPTYGKRIQHFLTVQFKTGETGDFVELEMGKDVAPNLIATLEARSGIKIDKTGA